MFEYIIEKISLSVCSNVYEREREREREREKEWESEREREEGERDGSASIIFCSIV